MKGLLWLFTVACVMRGNLAQSCKYVNCNNLGCCVPKEQNLSLVITKKTNNGIRVLSSSSVDDWNVHLQASRHIPQRQNWKLSCELVQNTEEFPKCGICFTAAGRCKMECKLKEISLTTCYLLVNHDFQGIGQVAGLEFSVSCCKGMNDCSSVLQCSAIDCEGTKDYNMEPLNGSIRLPDCKTMHGTPTPTTGASIDPSESTLIHGKTNQQPSTTLSRTPGKTPIKTPESTGRRGDRKRQPSSSSLTIVVSAFGSLIFLILVAVLALLMICIFQKRKHHQYRNGNVLANSQRPSLPGESSHYECGVMNGSRPQAIPLNSQQPSHYETTTATNGVYSVLEPPDETQDSDQPHGGSNTLLNHYATAAEQHIYEDAERYIGFQPSADGDDYAKPDDALFDERKHQIQPKSVKEFLFVRSASLHRLAGGKGCGKQKTTQYHPPDDNDDYSIPSDAILEEKVKQPQTQESDGSILDPLYHELEMNEQQMQTKDDSSSIGVTKGRPVAIESTQPTVSAPAPATAASNLEPDSNNTSHMDAENTSLNWGDQDNSSDPDQTT